MLSEDEITQRIQKKILSVFLKFKEICEKHSLIYFAIGGTAIGAIRHKGFIPWDDDLDVGMPYKDYLKFLQVCDEELGDNYSILGPDNCKHYLSSYIKLQDNNTTFIEDLAHGYQDRYGGVYIDIFPVFGAPNDEKERKKIRNKIEKWKIKNFYLRFPINDKMNRTIFHKIRWLLFSPMRLFLKFNYFTTKQNMFLSRYVFGETDFVFFAWRPIPKNKSGTKQDFFNYSFFKSYIECPFENTTIRLMKDYDEYLKSDFGDYLKLPPLEKRVPVHPKTVIDLESGFSKYIHNKKS